MIQEENKTEVGLNITSVRMGFSELKFLSFFTVYLPSLKSHPNNIIHIKGWANYLSDESTEYHNILLTWELGAELPSWLKGSYIKNGPAHRKFGRGREYTSYLDRYTKRSGSY